MNYLDFERIMKALLLSIAVMVGIGFALLFIIYEDYTRPLKVANISGEFAYVYLPDTMFNISG